MGNSNQYLCGLPVRILIGHLEGIDTSSTLRDTLRSPNTKYITPLNCGRLNSYRGQSIFPLIAEVVELCGDKIEKNVFIRYILIRPQSVGCTLRWQWPIDLFLFLESVAICPHMSTCLILSLLIFTTIADTVQFPRCVFKHYDKWFFVRIAGFRILSIYKLNYCNGLSDLRLDTGIYYCP